jgi:mRNA interferase YafQ
MKYAVKFTAQFKRDYKLIKKRRFDIAELQAVVTMLAEGKTLSESYRDHALIGSYRNARECHIGPDWLLIYSISNEKLILELMRTGSHSDLF